MQPQAPIACAGLDAWSCSTHNDCTALYEQVGAECAECAPRDTFKACIPEKQAAGSCVGTTTCDRAQPAFPVGTTAGIANGCYTGSCIPNHFFL